MMNVMRMMCFWFYLILNKSWVSFNVSWVNGLSHGMDSRLLSPMGYLHIPFHFSFFFEWVLDLDLIHCIKRISSINRITSICHLIYLIRIYGVCITSSNLPICPELSRMPFDLAYFSKSTSLCFFFKIHCVYLLIDGSWQEGGGGGGGLLNLSPPDRGLMVGSDKLV